jgi:hypothetical protein
MMKARFGIAASVCYTALRVGGWSDAGRGLNVVEGLSLPFKAQLADSGPFASSEGRYRRSAFVFHLIDGGLELRRYRILWSRQREVGQELPAAIECSK